MKRLVLIAVLFLTVLALFAVSATALEIPRGTRVPGFTRPTATPPRNCDHSFKVSGVQAATCTEPGKEIRTCIRCGAETAIPKGSALGHDMKWSTWDPAPDCTTDGYAVYKCSRCDYTTRGLSERAWGHSTETTITKEATCITPGEKVAKCTDCDFTRRETIPATGKHNYVLEGEQKATCTQVGGRMYRCSECDGVRSEVTDALGHDWQPEAAVSATCTTNGYTTLRCRNCNETRKETIPATGNHSYVLEGEEPPTCVKVGLRAYRCGFCDDLKTETIAATGHAWEVTYSEPATCAADGYKSYKCKNCSQTRMDTIPATDNCTWGNWITVTEASCNQAGLKVAECTVCGDTKKETIPSEGAHDYRTTSTKAASCEEDGSKNYTCSKCGKNKTETVKATGHQWGEWRVTKEATEKATGTKERTCKDCGVKETESIPKKSAKPTATPKPTKTPKPTATPKNANTPMPNSSSMDKEASGATVGIEVFTTGNKVNMRRGPGKNYKLLANVPQKDTCLGQLLDAGLDKNGTVWFKVKYKKNECWITSQFAKAVVGEQDGAFRAVEGELTELSHFYLKSMSEAVEKLALEEYEDTETYSAGSSDGAVFVNGNEYAEHIELDGDGYTIYGVKVGDKIKDAQKKFKKAELVVNKDDNDMYAGAYVYDVVCSPDSLVIDDNGFDGQLIVYVDGDNKVAMMILQAYTE